MIWILEKSCSFSFSKYVASRSYVAEQKRISCGGRRLLLHVHWNWTYVFERLTYVSPAFARNMHTSHRRMAAIRPSIRLTILQFRKYYPFEQTTMKFSNIAIAAAVLATSGVNAFSTPAKFGVRQFTQLKATAVDAETKTALATAANEARGLAMDSIAAAHSGHMGLPLGCAEVGAVLYGSQVCIHSIFLNSVEICSNILSLHR